MRSVFVIGDSISIHYGPYLKEKMHGKYNYARKGVPSLNIFDDANAGDSSMVLDYLEMQFALGTKYDVVLFNCGLHDVRLDRETLQRNIDEELYRENLTKIVNLLLKMANRVVWLSTTPIVDKIHNKRAFGFYRLEEDITKYNKIASDIMHKNGIASIDLFNFAAQLKGDLYLDHVHFIERVREQQAGFIFQSLERIIC